jgi:hypothetical protein
MLAIVGLIQSPLVRSQREVIEAQKAHINTLDDLVVHLQLAWEDEDEPPENDPDELDQAKPIQETVEARGSVVPLKRTG